MPQMWTLVYFYVISFFGSVTSPMTPPVRRLLGWLVGRTPCIFLKSRSCTASGRGCNTVTKVTTGSRDAAHATTFMDGQTDGRTGINADGWTVMYQVR